MSGCGNEDGSCMRAQPQVQVSPMWLVSHGLIYGAGCGLWLSWRTSTFRICNMHWGLGWSSVLQRPRRVASFFARLAMCRLAPILIVPADREHVPHSHVRKSAQPRVLSMPSRPRISPVSTPASSIRGRQSSASPLAVQIANSEAQSVYLCYIP